MTKLKLKIHGIEVEYDGNKKFLETKVLQILEAVKKSHNEEVKKTLQELNEDLQQNLITLEGYSASVSQMNEEIARIIKENDESSMSILEKIRAHVNSPSDLIADTKNMQEMQMSFNLQYLMLQNKISQENRQFSLVSNIMKTKHDTAKNSINNIR
jgi:N-acetylglucosamine kinase-like BadF-type ATPase